MVLVSLIKHKGHTIGRQIGLKKRGLFATSADCKLGVTELIYARCKFAFHAAGTPTSSFTLCLVRRKVSDTLTTQVCKHRTKNRFAGNAHAWYIIFVGFFFKLICMYVKETGMKDMKQPPTFIHLSDLPHEQPLSSLAHYITYKKHPAAMKGSEQGR